MITRPTWERPLRRRLSKALDRRGLPHGWLRENASLLTVWAIVQGVLMIAGEKQLGPAGGATGIAMAAGLAGAFLGFCVRSRWHHQAWLTEWTPASHEIARRIQTREVFGALAPIAVAVLAISGGIAAFSDSTGVIAALGAATLATTSGFLLSGGRISHALLCASGVWTGGYGLLSPWLLDEKGDMWERLVTGASLGWLPVLPWSIVYHESRTGTLQLMLLAVALAIALRDWWRSWQDRTHVPAAVAFRALVTPEAEETEEEAAEAADPRPSGEEQRAEIRKQVAFAWFGMAGYMPGQPMPRLDRWIWRWLTPRQRLISTLGSHDAFIWSAQTRWTFLSLAGLAALAWLPRLALRQADFGAWFDGHAFWLLIAIVALAAVAVMSGWPARRSRFQPWLEPMEAQGIGRFPGFAMLPVCPGEWIRAVAKEWTLRAAWVSLLWVLPVLAWVPLFAPDGGAAWWILVPFLIHASLFPLAVMNRLIRSVSGSVFSSHGFSRTVPAVIAGFACVTVSLAAIGAAATGFAAASLALLLAAAGFGGFGLRLILLRCKGMRLDLRPKRPD